MKMHAKLSKNGDYIHAETSGVIDQNAVESVLKKMPALISRYGIKRILHDLRNAEIRLDAQDIYFTPRKIQEAGYHDTKRAFLFSMENEQDFAFFETVSTNQGHLIKVFTDKAEALSWLQA